MSEAVAVETIKKLVKQGAEKAELYFPHLSPRARLKFRAASFLFAIALEDVSDAELLAAATRLIGLRPIQHVLMLAATVVLHGTLGTGAADASDAAAEALWKRAATGEPEDAVEDAFDAATFLESKLEPGPPVPFTPGGIGVKG